MRFIKCLSFLLCLFSAADALSQVRAGTIVRKQVVEEKDSIEYYETDFTSRQKSYLNLLVGTWHMNTMKRQARMQAETLSDVMLSLKADSTFTGTAGCNSISGTFSIKGTSIKFKNVVATEMACNRLEQEVWFLKLLQNTVSNYSVDDLTLFLRDGSGNIVIKADKSK